MPTATWRELIGTAFHDAKFYVPASAREIGHAERELEIVFPPELRELLLETNGVSANHGAPLVWPVDEIIAQNRHFRTSREFARLYAPFTDLLFFGAEGNGDQFAYRVEGGRIGDPSIHEWDHETDARSRFSSDLKEYVSRMAASIGPPAPYRRSLLSRILARLRGSATAIAALAATLACAEAQGTEGRLEFTAHGPVSQVRAGLHPLGLGAGRDGFLFVPGDNDAQRPQPLLILLHGATQRARLFERLTPAADSVGVVILAPDSRETTWDAIRAGFGADVAFLQRAIERAFDRAHLDPCRIVIGGFSDGATYALSLGIRNAQALRGVVAFSPGFVLPVREVQLLPVFMRHGTQDEILPIDRTSRPILAALQSAGFSVDYEEFAGPHTIRPMDARAALHWVTQRSCAGVRAR